MPQATDQLREEWADDAVAMDYLKAAGYRLTRRWTWIVPPNHLPTEKELRAVDYLFQEWDFGGIE